MTNIASEFADYNYNLVQVPEISSPANIQDALRLYHHGTTDTDPDVTKEYFANSIAGILTDLENTKRDIGILQLQNNLSLNTYTTSGVYVQLTDEAATTAVQYPVNGRGGLLRVESETGVVFQSYHDNQNSVYSRAFWGGAWTSWQQQLDGRHNHDDLYYRKSIVDDKPTVYLGRDQSGNQLVSATRKMIVAAPITDPVSGLQVPNVPELPPLIPGDIWFW